MFDFLLPGRLYFMHMYDVRLNSNVTRGEVINTERGSVQVRLWLYHQEEPVEFKAEGDCLRDVAGSHFHFINRPLEPFQELDFSLDALTLLPGVTGEITASSRLCMHKPNELGEYGKPTYINVPVSYTHLTLPTTSRV